MREDATELLIRRLGGFGPLSEEDKRVLRRVPLATRDVVAHQDLIGEGQEAKQCFLLVEGFACRYGLVKDGRRQIAAFYLPGDLCGLHGLLPGPSNHGIATLKPAVVAPIPHGAVAEWMERPGLRGLLWRVVLVEGSVFGEWVVNVGRRPAVERVAHLLCELVMRLAAVGLARGARCALPITQAELADATGLSAVHVNRSLQVLRSQGLIELRGGTLVVPDWNGLQRLGGFDPAYLHQVAMAA